jgi:hypothetical protein
MLKKSIPMLIRFVGKVLCYNWVFIADDPAVEVKGVVTSEGLFDGALTWPDGNAIFIEPTSR